MKQSQVIAVNPEVSSLAKQVAANLMRTYDTNNSTALENSEVASAQIDAYRAIGRVYVPTQFDIAGYGSTLDANADGKVTLYDLEKVCERYIGMWAAMYPQVKKTEEVKKAAVVWTEEELLKRSEIRKQISFIRQLFEKFDTDRSGSIGAHEVNNLLEETYKIMGITRKFTTEDVRSFMKMMDKNLDDQITYKEYEDSIINSLMRKNINIV